MVRVRAVPVPAVLLLLLGCQMVSATLLGSVLEPAYGTAGLLFGSLLEITVFFTFADACGFSNRRTAPSLDTKPRFWPEPTGPASGAFIASTSFFAS